MWGGDGAAEDDNKGYVHDKMDCDTDKAGDSLMGGEDLQSRDQRLYSQAKGSQKCWEGEARGVCGKQDKQRGRGTAQA